MMPPHEAGTIMKSLIVKRSIVLAGRNSSVNVMLSELIDGINAQRQHGNLSSALRLFVLEYYRGKAAEKPGDEMLGQQSPPTAPVLS